MRPFHEDRGLEDQLFEVFDKKGQFIKKIFWEIEKIDEEFFRIVRFNIGGSFFPYRFIKKKQSVWDVPSISLRFSLDKKSDSGEGFLNILLHV